MIQLPATIVLVIAIGQGGKLDVADQFKNLNAGAIEITEGMSADSMMEQFMGGGNSGAPNFGGGMPDFGGNAPALSASTLSPAESPLIISTYLPSENPVITSFSDTSPSAP